MDHGPEPKKKRHYDDESCTVSNFKDFKTDAVETTREKSAKEVDIQSLPVS